MIEDDTTLAGIERFDDVTLVIPCGGCGERMGGVAKPLLRGSDGVTILERIETILGPIVAETVVVAPPKMQAALQRVSRARFVSDDGAGPFCALVSVARDAHTRWMLVVGGDHPKPSLALARRIVVRRGDDSDVVAVVVDGAPEPLFALYRTSWIAMLGEGETRPRSFRAAYARAKIAVIDAADLDAADRAALLDADTPEDAVLHGLSNT